MKTILTFGLALLLGSICLAQQGINYKAVIKDGSGTIIANDIIQIQFTILEGAVPVYEESHTPTTDDNGIIIVNIGEGTLISGVYADIDWVSNQHSLNVQVNTGSGLVDLGTTEFKAVPYALATEKIELPYFDSTSQSGAAFHVHNNFNNGRFGLAGSVGLDGEILPNNNAGVMGVGVVAHGVYGLSKTSFLAGVQGVSESSTGYGVLGYGIGGGVGGHFYTTTFGVAALTTGVGNVGFGITNPVNPLSVYQDTGSANTVRIESGSHPVGKDLLELIIPDGSSAGSQFIEMQNGNDIVAVVNGDGSARFKSVQFEDFSTQTTAAIGPLAYGSISLTGSITSGSGNYSIVWNVNRYEITIPGENYHFANYTSVVTPASAAVRSVRTSSASGNLVVYLYDSTGANIQGNFHFLVFK